MIEASQKIVELEADVAFLLLRSGSAGSVSFTSDRWTGMSSNSLVAFAYGGEQRHMPADRGDYAACVRTYVRLPRHRKTSAVRAALRNAREAYLRRYPADRYPEQRRAIRAEWEAERQEREKATRKRRRWSPARQEV